MRHDVLGPERDDGDRYTDDGHHCPRTERATKQARDGRDKQQGQRKSGWLEPMSDMGGTYLQWSPDVAGTGCAADGRVEVVEHA
jgi:hypothetical protein